MTTFGFTWTDGNEAEIYDIDHKTVIGVTDSGHSGAATKNGNPVGWERVAYEWIADQSVADEQQLAEAIDRLAAVGAGRIEEIGQ